MTVRLAGIRRVRSDAVGRRLHALVWRLELLFEPRDCWVGVYWSLPPSRGKLNIYICLLPMLPINLTVWRTR